MGDVPIAFAFTAGLVATVNPCGFAMLPAYLSYFMGLDDRVDVAAAPVGGARSVGRGLVVGGVVSAGFLVVFGVSGALVNAGFRSVIDVVPWVALVVGIGVMALGVAMLFGYQPLVSLPHLERGGSSRSYRSVFLFGVSYAVASLSCALPVFLAVTGAAAATPTFAAGIATYLVYGLGMSMLLIVLTLALALARDGVVRRVRGLAPRIARISGALLVLSGAYVTVYWTANLRDPLAARGATFTFVEGLQTWITGQLGSRPGLWGAVFGGVIAAAVAFVARSRWRARPSTPVSTPASSTRAR